MNKMKKIMAAIGFAQEPTEILEKVMALDFSRKVKIYLVHIINEAPRYSYYYDAYKLWEEFRDKAVKETLEKMTDYIKILQKEFSDIEPIIEVGIPADKVVELSESLDVDLIIVGHHIRKGLENFLHRKTGLHIVGMSKRPVLSLYINVEE